MFLYDVFPPEFIKIGIEAENKDEVFEELVDYFCQTQKSDARREILDVVLLRESKMSTGIAKGLAIPHGITDAVKAIHGILGISKKGIDYDSLDGEPVNLVFMLLAPKTFTEKYLRLLMRLAELLEIPEFFRDLLAQKDSRSANQIIKKYENILYSSKTDKA